MIRKGERALIREGFQGLMGCDMYIVAGKDFDLMAEVAVCFPYIECV